MISIVTWSSKQVAIVMKKSRVWAGKMVQWVQYLQPSPQGPEFQPQDHKVEG